MSLYYFHIRDGQTLIRDDEGMECRDLVAAMAEALYSARDLAVAATAAGSVRPAATVEIEDEDGNRVGDVAAPRMLH